MRITRSPTQRGPIVRVSPLLWVVVIAIVVALAFSPAHLYQSSRWLLGILVDPILPIFERLHVPRPDFHRRLVIRRPPDTLCSNVSYKPAPV